MEQALVEIKGGDTIQSALGRLANALENPKELWDAIGFEMAEDTRLRISDGEDINGQPFTPSIRVQQNGILCHLKANGIPQFLWIFKRICQSP
jgi:hypothetical protein